VVLHVPLGFIREAIIRVGAFDGTRGLVQDLVGLLNEGFDLLDELSLIAVILLLGFHVFNMLQGEEG
jgi:hypothetical protein